MITFAQTDPGVRGGAPGAGGPIARLSNKESKFFAAGREAFAEVNDVQGTIAGDAGLGPTFNMDSCAGCHAAPALGGSSPAVNPQVAVATKEGAVNTVPSFITLSGPVREARFVFKDPPLNSMRDGGVHGLFTIKGRTDAPDCNLVQEDFATQVGFNNVIFRIPTPVFGAGLIEAIQDSTIAANEAVTPVKLALGITGHANRTGNDGTITRFGWKAQNKSLVIFSGEAYNVEQGVSNEAFPDERVQSPGCNVNATPEDHTNFDLSNPTSVSSDVIKFSNFMRFLGPPTPAPQTASAANGAALFTYIGCAACHLPSMQTGNHSTAALAQVTANLFSDMLVHRMGTGLADGVAQGDAGFDEFRTAPLWGLGQRRFFLHDGRTSDLLQAILEHSSSGSEANTVIGNFGALRPAEKQDILNFLRSL